jgi:hypothetical protein
LRSLITLKFFSLLFRIHPNEPLNNQEIIYLTAPKSFRSGFYFYPVG